MSEAPDLITVAEAAERFNLTATTIRRWLWRGDIKQYGRELGQVRVYVDATEIARKLRPAATPDGNGKGA